MERTSNSNKLSNKSTEPEFVYKLLILGDSSVGKTCFLLRYCDNLYNENHIATIGVDYRVKNIEIENSKIKLQVWDTAGQDRFKSITKSYYKGAHGILLLFDITSRESFHNIRSWVDTIKNNTVIGAPIILIANKIDLTDSRVISKEEAEEFANSKDLIYIESSARLNTNVKESFMMLCKKIHDEKIVESVVDKKKKIEEYKKELEKDDSRCCGGKKK